MADVRVRRLEFEGPAPANQPFPIQVVVNNLETTAASWQENTCSDPQPGHRTDVTVVVRDGAGNEVYSETKRRCIPRNRVFEMLGGNARVEFRPELDPGEYVVEAQVSVINESRTHSASPRSLTVSGSADSIPSGDDPGGGDPFGGGGDDQSDDGGSPFSGNGGGGDPLGDFGLGIGTSNVLVGVIVLALLAWLASSTSEVIG